MYNKQTKVDVEFRSSPYKIFDAGNLHYSLCFYSLKKTNFACSKVHLQLGKNANGHIYAEKSKMENHKMSHDSIDLIIQ